MALRPLVLASLGALVACGGVSAYTAPLPAAGATGEKGTADDGTGQLARASVKLEIEATADDPVQEFGDEEARRAAAASSNNYDEYGGYLYGGDEYGGGVYGGASYASYNPYQWGYGQPVNRALDYTVHSLGDAGAVAGTVSWGSTPGERRIASPCGEIDNPTLRLGAHGEAGGAVVYLEGITQGKALPYANKPIVVGGTVEKIGCALHPAAQVLSPAPGTVSIYNDDHRDAMIVRAAKLDPVTVKLAPGGYRQVAIAVGVTTIADESSKLAPAWVVAVGHPYFALTDDTGRFKISDVVPGTYKLVVWHPPVVTGWRDGKPQYGAPVTVTRTIKVTAYATAKADVALK